MSRLLAQLASTDMTFNLRLIPMVLGVAELTLRAPRALLVGVLGATTVIVYRADLTPLELAKVVALLPLGLGSLLTYLSLPPATRARYLVPFTRYINVAVFGNIAMMLFTPTGGTVRGVAGKLTATVLLVWLSQQARAVQWRTVQVLDNGAFVYHALSMRWVLTHAIYRSVLLTLPAFSTRHRYMDAFSLALMTVLSTRITTSPPLPRSAFFGLADTLVAPSFAALTSLYAVVGWQTAISAGGPLVLDASADWALAGVSVAAGGYALSQVLSLTA
ncbi:hypothetical protein BC828DRAFT_366955 [Blastocladiella britannica]|nr:hypothetical protein BC828DRAFT_366955 [Blastocladiella britannica]